jgi:hypothetical protein
MLSTQDGTRKEKESGDAATASLLDKLPSKVHVIHLTEAINLQRKPAVVERTNETLLAGVRTSARRKTLSIV